MKCSRANEIPAYKRIQAAILKRVDVGQLKTGDLVESERKLAKIHGVSLMTARHALASLESEGIVERRGSSGTFVAPPKIHFNKLVSFSEQMAARGLAAASRVLSPIEIYNEQDIAARLELPVTSRLIRIERLRLGAGEPFALETCYLPAEQFGGLLQTGLRRGSLFYTLEHDYGVQLSHADEVIDASIVDHRSARLMGISHQLPLLRIRQVIYSSEDKATAFVLGLYRSDRHNLLIRRYR